MNNSGGNKTSNHFIQVKRKVDIVDNTSIHKKFKKGTEPEIFEYLVSRAVGSKFNY